MASDNGTPFFDYYQFLGIEPDATPEEIEQAIYRIEENDKRLRIWPAEHANIDRRARYLRDARRFLLDPAERAAYDIKHHRNVAQGGNEILWVPKGYKFTPDDLEPALTVRALGPKFDSDWQRAIASINGKLVQQTLNIVAQKQPDALQPRYAAVEMELTRLSAAYGQHRPNRMVESAIILCDDWIERAGGSVENHPIESAAGELLVARQARPDLPQIAKFRLQRATDRRGCLFGYAWIEEPWASITDPQPETFPVNGAVNGATYRGGYFELVGNDAKEFTISMTSDALMRLRRPDQHSLTIHFSLQPETAHARFTKIVMPVNITLIPAKAAFEPASVTLAPVPRGKKQGTTVHIVNKGEAPLNACREPWGDPVIALDDTLADTGGEVRVILDTSSLRPGERFQKVVNYQADGDNAKISLLINGELLPTAWQHVWRLQPARDRWTLAGTFALFALLLGPIVEGLFHQAPVAFWVVAALAATGGAVGVAYRIGLSVIRHMRAAGNEQVSETTMPWPVILGASGAGVVLVSLLLALASWEPWQKAFWFVVLIACVCAAWGFFVNEDLVVYPRKPGNTATNIPPVADSKPQPVASGVKVAAVLLALTFFIAGLFFDASLVGFLLLFSLPIAFVVTVIAISTAS